MPLNSKGAAGRNERVSRQLNKRIVLLYAIFFKTLGKECSDESYLDSLNLSTNFSLTSPSWVWASVLKPSTTRPASWTSFWSTFILFSLVFSSELCPFTLYSKRVLSFFPDKWQMFQVVMEPNSLLALTNKSSWNPGPKCQLFYCEGPL